MPIPGTSMYAEGIKKGWIDPKKPFSEYDSTGQIVNTGDITDKDLKFMYNLFWKKFYLRRKLISRELLRMMSSPKEFIRVLRGAWSFYLRVFSPRKNLNEEHCCYCPLGLLVFARGKFKVIFFFIKEMIKKNYNVTLILTSREEVDFCKKKFKCNTLQIKNIKLTRWDPIFLKIAKYIKFIFSCHILLRKGNFDAVYGINLIQTILIIFLPKKIKKWIIFVDLWAAIFYNTHKKKYFYPLMRIVRFF